MKHVVTLTTSNPAHEFVSLRRKQSTTNFMVEAANEEQAVLRATAHFRRLGHYIHEAKIFKKKSLNEFRRVPFPDVLPDVVPYFPKPSITPVHVPTEPPPAAPPGLKDLPDTVPPFKKIEAEIEELETASKTRQLSKDELDRLQSARTTRQKLTQSKVAPGKPKRARGILANLSMGGKLNTRDIGTLGQWRNLFPRYQPFGTESDSLNLQTANFDAVAPVYEGMGSMMNNKQAALKAIGRVMNKRNASKEQTKTDKNKINMEPKLVQNSMPGAKL